MIPHSWTRALIRAAVAVSVLTFGIAAWPLRADAVTSSQRDAADFLYRLALEYRQAGRTADAMHELRKALILDPEHPGAKRALHEMEQEQIGGYARQFAIDQALNQAGDPGTTEVAVEPGTDQQVEWERLTPPTAASEQAPPTPASAPSPVPAEPSAPAAAPARVPDPDINRVEWFYVFGPAGQPKYGALKEPQQFVVEVPAGASSVRIRILDADTRDSHDEMDGGWNTATSFRVTGPGADDEQVIGPEAPDGTVVDFGPYAVTGAAQFQVEARGVEGDDNNLFAFEVSPSGAEAYALQPAIRLADRRGTQMRFFPQIPPGALRVIVEQNYDLDPDGGEAALVPVTRYGRRQRGIPLRGSGSGSWSTTEVAVPSETDGTRWTYQITKGTQHKGNMSFRVADASGRLLPIYTTPGADAARAAEPRGLEPWQSPPAPGAESGQPRTQPSPGWRSDDAAPGVSGACNAFEFDGSKSHDPDRGELTYRWDFGDGTTAEGVRVQHTYTEAGNYPVVLRVQDNTTTECCVSEARHVLPVNLPPKAVLEAPAKGCAAADIAFSAARSSDSPGEPLRYRWEFGDGGSAEGPDVTHIYMKSGEYQVRVTVDDGRGTPCSTDRATAMVAVNGPPVVRTAGPIRACAVAPTGAMDIAFDASGSTDPDGDTLTYTWDFGDGSSGDGKSVSHAYEGGGHYTATVTADDGSGTACSATMGIVPVFLNHPPVASAGQAAAGCPGEAIAFNGSGSTDADGNVVTYAWDFGDGHTASGAAVEHRYDESGTYRVTLTVNDGSGMDCSTDTSATSAAINAPPVAHMTIRGAKGAEFTAAGAPVPVEPAPADPTP
jgi:PKD repeat protein